MITSKNFSWELERGSLVDTRLSAFFYRSLGRQEELNNFTKEQNASTSTLVRKKLTSPHKKVVNKSFKYELEFFGGECRRSPNCINIPTPLSEISSNVWRALIGIEDSRFLNHAGLDWISIVRAMLVNIRAGRIVQGGSTLTQQLAKNLYFSTERTFSRKFKEALFSMLLEIKYSKEELIEAYLNNVYWGSYKGLSIVGIKAASLFYFEKHPNELDEYEAAILIGMLKGPNLYSPFYKNHKFIINRSNLIYKKLTAEGFFFGKIDQWSTRSWDKWLTTNFDERFYLLGALNFEKNISFEVFTLNYFLNKKLQWLGSTFKKGEFEYQVFWKNISGREISIISRDGIIEQRKNTGSLLKPIVYGLLFEEIDPGQEFETAPLEIKLKSGKWNPSDHFKGEGPISLSIALGQSLNLPYLRASIEYGFDRLEVELAEVLPDLKRPLREYPAQLLGSYEMTPSQVFDIYRPFLEKKCESKGIRHVYKILSDPTNSTTARWMKELEGASFFGKTGTSNNGFDNWYIFHDSIDLFVIWIGHVGPRDVGSFALSGAGVSFDVLRDFLTSRAKNIGQSTCD